MIKSITFENYRTFIKSSTIEIKPITILVGPNSSGKSSILKLLGLFSQTYLDGGTGELLKYNGKLVNLDGLESIKGLNSRLPMKIRVTLEQPPNINLPPNVIQHAEIGIIINEESNLHIESGVINGKSKNIELSINKIHSALAVSQFNMKDIKKTLLTDIQLFSSFMTAYRNITGTMISTEDIIDDIIQEIVKNVTVYYSRLQIVDIRDNDYSNDFENNPEKYITDETVIDQFKEWKESLLKNRSKWDILIKPYSNEEINGLLKLIYEKKQGKILNIPSSDILEIVKLVCLKIMMRPISELVSQWDQHETEDYQSILNNSLNKIITIDPLRQNPQRTYTSEELAINIFRSADLTDLEDIYSTKLFERISNDLHHLGTNLDFNIEQLKVREQLVNLYDLYLHDSMNNKMYSLNQLGFGISQVLPIIASLENFRNRIDCAPLFLIEQPELHLHPRMQSRLSTIFNNCLYYSDEIELGNARNDNSIMIETHSEHLVKGFQVLIAKGKLNHEDIAVYFIDKNEQGESIVNKYDIDKNGFFTEPWPSGFFDQSFLQSMEIVGGVN